MTKWFTSENGDKFGPLNLSTPPLPQTMLLLLLPSAAFSIYNKESQKIGLKFNGDKPGWVSFQSFNLIVPLLLLFLFVRAGFMIAFYPFTIDRQTTKICFYQTSWWRLNYHRERFRKLTFWAPFVTANRGIVGCCGLYESVEELCHWWKYGHMNLWIN